MQFAVFNFWRSSLPGPTWPNRFFIHAPTSGGLTDSPGTAAVLGGFSFANGTLCERLKQVGKNWRIYHDGRPQSIGIDSLHHPEPPDPYPTANFQTDQKIEEGNGLSKIDKRLDDVTFLSERKLPR